jgi:hypothetical protein
MVTQYFHGSLTNQEMGDQKTKKWLRKIPIPEDSQDLKDSKDSEKSNTPRIHSLQGLQILQDSKD